MIRLFVAVELPSHVRRELAGWAARLAARTSAFRWVSPANIHLTLKFLGNTPDRMVPKVAAALEEAAGATAPFALTVNGWGAFPTPQRPRILWAGLGGEVSSATLLAERIELALEPLGSPRDERPFAPHLTLARLARGQSAPPLATILPGDLEHPEGAMLAVNEFSLMASELNPAGARYSTLSRHPLSGRVCQ